MTHQKDVVQTGFWPLFRYDPRDSPRRRASVPSGQPQTDQTVQGIRDARRLALPCWPASDPEHAEHLFELAQKDIDDQWHYYEQMAGVEREIVDEFGGGRSMSVDLSTHYLGTEAEEPARRGRLPAVDRRPGHAAAAGGCRRGGGRVAFAVRRADRTRGSGVQPAVRVPDRIVCRIADALSRAGRLQHRARGIICSHVEAAKQAVSIPDHRQLERCFARRLDSLRQDDRRSRRRRAGVEHLLRSHRRRHDGGRRRATLHRSGGRSAAIGVAPLAVKIGPELHQPAATSPSNWWRPGPTDWCCSIAIWKRTSISRRLQIKPDLVLSNRHEARVPIRWIAILRDQLTRVAGRDQRRASHARRAQAAVGRSGRDDDGQHPVDEGPRVSEHAARRDAASGWRRTSTIRSSR